MNDISIDLETLSTRHDAAILSIGATQFDRNTGEIGDKFYREVCIDSAIENGHVSGSTLSWWMQQSERARELFAETRWKLSLGGALNDLQVFVERRPAAKVWGNGATFDITILEQAYAKSGRSAPWEYWNIRDLRTLVDAAEANGFDKASIPFEGTAHNALDDAVHQAKIASAAWRAVTNRISPATVTALVDALDAQLG